MLTRRKLKEQLSVHILRRPLGSGSTLITVFGQKRERSIGEAGPAAGCTVGTCEGRRAESPRPPPNAVQGAAERYQGSRVGVGATAAVYIYATAVNKGPK